MPVRADRDGVLVDLWVQPRAGRSGVAGVQGDAVKVRVAAPPVDGRANDALLRLLAEAVGVPRRDVALVRGQGGRRKTVRIRGTTPEAVRAALGVG